MTDFLWQTFHRLVSEADRPYRRFLYDKLDLQHRLIGIIGPRGVGKTTLCLQFIKNELYDKGGVFYFSADNVFFNETPILDFVDQLYQHQNIRIFFIDEIHKYPNWNQELKNIYDSFPDVHVVFSGSSSIDLITGSYDLSRRAKLLHLPGLSFREYLNIKIDKNFDAISLDELLSNHQAIAAQFSKENLMLKYFEEYSLYGSYPIVFQNYEGLYEALANVIEKTIYEDIAKFYNLKTKNLNQFQRILNFLASIPPGKVTINNLAQHLSIDNKTAEHYLYILQKTGLVKALYPMASGNQLLTKPEKIYLDNTTLLATINTFLSGTLEVGTMRELMFLQSIAGAELKAFFPKKGDFQIDDIVFEVGGKNKSWQQLKSVDGKKFLVKDNILVGLKNEIPLYLFGFLY